MWIIPKNLHTSAYVPDTEALISDLNELSVLCEQSLLVKSKASPARTWLRRWNSGSLNQHLSGRILKPSLGNSFAEKWTSSVEAFHVNHSVPRESKQEIKTQDISGPTSSEELRYADLPFFSLKTSQESLEQSLDKTGEQTSKGLRYSYISLENWNAESIHRRGEYSQRAKLGHHTSVKGFSFLLKQMNSNSQGLITSQAKLNNQSCSETTLGQSQMSGQESEEIFNTFGNHLEQSQEIKTWATPRTSMAPMGGSSSETDSRWENRLENQMLGNVQGVPPSEKKVLNPRWVEAMMGLPIGWVSPSCTNPLLIEQTNLDSLGMGLSQPPRRELSKSYGNKSTVDWPTPTLPGFTQDPEKLVDKDGNPWAGQGRAYLNGLNKTVSLNTAVLSQDAKCWGTPTVMDSYQIERSIDATIHQATLGNRKGRTTSSNLAEQVVFPITTEIYLLVKEYYANGGEEDGVGSFVKGKLQNWSTPSAGQNGTDLLCYLKRKLNQRKKGGHQINSMLKLETEMDDLGLYFNPNKISTEDLERMIEKVKTLTGRK